MPKRSQVVKKCSTLSDLWSVNLPKYLIRGLLSTNLLLLLVRTELILIAQWPSRSQFRSFQMRMETRFLRMCHKMNRINILNILRAWISWMKMTMMIKTLRNPKARKSEFLSLSTWDHTLPLIKGSRRGPSYSNKENPGLERDSISSIYWKNWEISISWRPCYWMNSN